MIDRLRNCEGTVANHALKFTDINVRVGAQGKVRGISTNVNTLRAEVATLRKVVVQTNIVDISTH